MTVYNFAYTAPFPENTKITQQQAFEALRVKCRDPMKFVPVFSACELLEETPTFVRRRVTTKTGDVLVEEANLYAPSFVKFKASNGLDVINMLSETATGGLLLTFAYSFPLPVDLVPGSEEEAKNKTDIQEMARTNVSKSLETILGMFTQGKLD